MNMMLLHDLFIIDRLEPGDGVIKASLRVDPRHPVFAGHFPGRPILPGVCLVQLVQELLAAAARDPRHATTRDPRHATTRDIRLATAGPVKFIAMVEPERDTPLQLTVRTVEDLAGDGRVEAEATYAGKPCFRFTGTFRGASGYAG